MVTCLLDVIIAGLLGGEPEEYSALCGKEKGSHIMSINRKTIWQNVQYPEKDEHPMGLCTLNIHPRPGTCALRIHFDDLNLLPDTLVDYDSSNCPSSQPFFKAIGPEGPTAVYCQKLDGFEAILDVSDTYEARTLLLQLDETKEFKFRVNITAVSCDDITDYESPANCGIKNKNLVALRAEPSEEEDSKQSKDQVDTADEESLPLSSRQERRNPVDSKKNKNKQKEGEERKKSEMIPKDIWDVKVKDLAENLEVGPKKQIGGKVLGDETRINEWPWMVYIETRYEDSYWPCNGLLLDESHVLTSRDCVMAVPQSPFNIDDMTVSIGDHDIYDDSEIKSKKVGVSKITIPIQNGYYDTKDAFAVLQLSDKVEFSGKIRPICLPVSYNKFDDSGVIAGWDFSGIVSNPAVPHKAKVTLVDEEYCQAVLEGFKEVLDNEGNYELEVDADNAVCALETDTFGSFAGPVCTFESGSSLIQRDQRGAWYVRGVASMIQLCLFEGLPTYFSQVQPENQFLNIALG